MSDTNDINSLYGYQKSSCLRLWPVLAPLGTAARNNADWEGSGWLRFGGLGFRV